MSNVIKTSNKANDRRLANILRRLDEAHHLAVTDIPEEEDAENQEQEQGADFADAANVQRANEAGLLSELLRNYNAGSVGGVLVSVRNDATFTQPVQGNIVKMSNANVSPFYLFNTADNPQPIDFVMTINPELNSATIELTPASQDHRALVALLMQNMRSSVNCVLKPDNRTFTISSTEANTLPHHLCRSCLTSERETRIHGITPDLLEAPYCVELKTCATNTAGAATQRLVEALAQYRGLAYLTYRAGISVTEDNVVVSNNVYINPLTATFLKIAYRTGRAIQAKMNQSLNNSTFIDLATPYITPPTKGNQQSFTLQDITKWESLIDESKMMDKFDRGLLKPLPPVELAKVPTTCAYKNPKNSLTNLPLFYPTSLMDSDDFFQDVMRVTSGQIFLGADAFRHAFGHFTNLKEISFDPNNQQHKMEVMKGYHTSELVYSSEPVVTTTKGASTQNVVKNEDWFQEMLQNKITEKEKQEGLQTLEPDLGNYMFLLEKKEDLSRFTYEVSLGGPKKVKEDYSDEVWDNLLFNMEELFSEFTNSMKKLGGFTVVKSKIHNALILVEGYGKCNGRYKVLLKGSAPSFTSHWSTLPGGWLVSKHFFTFTKEQATKISTNRLKLRVMKSIIEDYMVISDYVALKDGLRLDPVIASEVESRQAKFQNHTFLFLFMCSLRMTKALIDEMSLIRYAGMELTTPNRDVYKIFADIERFTRTKQQAWWHHLLLKTLVLFKDGKRVEPITQQEVPFGQFLQTFFYHFINLFPETDSFHAHLTILLKTLALDKDCPLLENPTPEQKKMSKEKYLHRVVEDPDEIKRFEFDANVVSTLGYTLGKSLNPRTVLTSYIEKCSGIRASSNTTMRSSVHIDAEAPEDPEKVLNEAKWEPKAMQEEEFDKHRSTKTQQFLNISKEDELEHESILKELEEVQKAKTYLNEGEKFKKLSSVNKRLLAWVDRVSKTNVSKSHCLFEFLELGWKKEPSQMFNEIFEQFILQIMRITQFAKKQATGNREIFVCTFVTKIVVKMVEVFFKIIGLLIENEAISDHKRKKSIFEEFMKKTSVSNDNGFSKTVRRFTSSDAEKFSQNLTYPMFACFTTGLFKGLETAEAELSAKEKTHSKLKVDLVATTKTHNNNITSTTTNHAVTPETEEEKGKDASSFTLTNVRNFILSVFSKMTEKRIVIKKEIVKRFSKIEDEVVYILGGSQASQEMWAKVQNKDLVVKLAAILKKTNKKYDFANQEFLLATAMMQGIFQQTASSIHCWGLFTLHKMVAEKVLQCVSNISNILRITVHSDSVGTSDDTGSMLGSIVEVPLAPHRSLMPAAEAEAVDKLVSSTLANLGHVMDCLLYNTERCKKLFQIWVSKKKASISATHLEFNSMWNVDNDLIMPLVKVCHSVIHSLCGLAANKKIQTAFSGICECATQGVPLKVMYTISQCAKYFTEKSVYGREYDSLIEDLQRTNDPGLLMFPLLPPNLVGFIPFTSILILLCSGNFGRVPLSIKRSGVMTERVSMVSASTMFSFNKKIQAVLEKLGVSKKSVNDFYKENEDIFIADMSGVSSDPRRMSIYKLLEPSIADSLTFKSGFNDLAARAYIYQNIAIHPSVEEALVAVGLVPYEDSIHKEAVLSKKTAEVINSSHRKRYNAKDLIRCSLLVDEEPSEEEEHVRHVEECLPLFKQVLIGIDSRHNRSLGSLRKITGVAFVNDEAIRLILKKVYLSSQSSHSQATWDRFDELVSHHTGFKRTLTETFKEIEPLTLAALLQKKKNSKDFLFRSKLSATTLLSAANCNAYFASSYRHHYRFGYPEEQKHQTQNLSWLGDASDVASSDAHTAKEDSYVDTRTASALTTCLRRATMLLWLFCNGFPSIRVKCLEELIGLTAEMICYYNSVVSVRRMIIIIRTLNAIYHDVNNLALSVPEHLYNLADFFPRGVSEMNWDTYVKAISADGDVIVVKGNSLFYSEETALTKRILNRKEYNAEKVNFTLSKRETSIIFFPNLLVVKCLITSKKEQFNLEMFHLTLPVPHEMDEWVAKTVANCHPNKNYLQSLVSDKLKAKEMGSNLVNIFAGYSPEPDALTKATFPGDWKISSHKMQALAVKEREQEVEKNKADTTTLPELFSQLLHASTTPVKNTFGDVFRALEEYGATNYKPADDLCETESDGSDENSSLDDEDYAAGASAVDANNQDMSYDVISHHYRASEGEKILQLTEVLRPSKIEPITLNKKMHLTYQKTYAECGARPEHSTDFHLRIPFIYTQQLVTPAVAYNDAPEFANSVTNWKARTVFGKYYLTLTKDQFLGTAYLSVLWSKIERIPYKESDVIKGAGYWAIIEQVQPRVQVVLSEQTREETRHLVSEQTAYPTKREQFITNVFLGEGSSKIVEGYTRKFYTDNEKKLLYFNVNSSVVVVTPLKLASYLRSKYEAFKFSSVPAIVTEAELESNLSVVDEDNFETLFQEHRGDNADDDP